MFNLMNNEDLQHYLRCFFEWKFIRISIFIQCLFIPDSRNKQKSINSWSKENQIPIIDSTKSSHCVARWFVYLEKYLVPGNVVEEHSLSPAGQYSPAPVIVQTTYNYRYGITLVRLSSVL